jgi:hypothetical protein
LDECDDIRGSLSRPKCPNKKPLQPRTTEPSPTKAASSPSDDEQKDSERVVLGEHAIPQVPLGLALVEAVVNRRMKRGFLQEDESKPMKTISSWFDPGCPLLSAAPAALAARVTG